MANVYDAGQKVLDAAEDAWQHRSEGMRCTTCMHFVIKETHANLEERVADREAQLGRCRRHAPTLSGWPVVFGCRDWCGDHKLVLK